jgi:hypothetical protein
MPISFVLLIVTCALSVCSAHVPAPLPQADATPYYVGGGPY